MLSSAKPQSLRPLSLQVRNQKQWQRGVEDLCHHTGLLLPDVIRSLKDIEKGIIFSLCHAILFFFLVLCFLVSVVFFLSSCRLLEYFLEHFLDFHFDFHSKQYNFSVDACSGYYIMLRYITYYIMLHDIIQHIIRKLFQILCHHFTSFCEIYKADFPLLPFTVPIYKIIFLSIFLTYIYNHIRQCYHVCFNWHN